MKNVSIKKIKTIPLLSLFIFILALGSCQPIENSPDELGDAKVDVFISENPIYVLGSNDFSCTVLYEIEKPTQDVLGPRINLPNVYITFQSPTQKLKIHNAFVMINFSKGKVGPFQIKNSTLGSTITPVYFINPYLPPCDAGAGFTAAQVDSFDGRDSATIAALASPERCSPSSHVGNTYSQVCPFKVGNLPQYSSWKNEAGIVTASLYLQGSSLPRVISDQTKVTEYPWFKKIDFNIENPCLRFPDICK